MIYRHLLTRIHRHLRRTGLSASRFGELTMKDRRFVHDLRNGREPRPETEARVHAWIDQQEQSR